MRRSVAVTLTVLLTIGSSSPLAYLKLGAMVNERIIDATWRQMPIGYFISDRAGSGVSATDLRGAAERASASSSGVRDRGDAFLEVGVARDATQQAAEDLRRPAPAEHVGSLPVVAAERALFVDRHGVLVWFPEDATG